MRFLFTGYLVAWHWKIFSGMWNWGSFLRGNYCNIKLCTSNLISFSVFCLLCNHIRKIVVLQVPVYIAEITPMNVRGAFTSLCQVDIVLILHLSWNSWTPLFLLYIYRPSCMQLMLGCGQALAFLIGSLVSWRTLALIGHFFSQSFVATDTINS